jgi:hypothetical protein
VITKTILGLFILIAALPSMARAAIIELTPGKVLQVAFSIPANLPQTPTMVALSFITPFGSGATAFNEIQPFGSEIASLYNAGQLLGTDTETYWGNRVDQLTFNPNVFWKTSSNPFGGGIALVGGTASFGSLFQGTTSGMIDVAFTSGKVDIELNDALMFLAIGSSPVNFSYVTPAPTILSMTVVPEPSGILLFAIGVAVMIARHYGARSID